MSIRKTLITRLVVLAAMVLSETGWAQPVPTNHSRAAAESRLKTARWLFEDGKYDAAIAELLVVYSIAPEPVVRYNFAKVHTAARHPVEAVDWLEACLANPATLTKMEIAWVAKTLEEQKTLVGTILITANVEGATIKVDKRDVGKTPLANPIRVASGSHVVTVEAAQYEQKDLTVDVAGSAQTSATFELIPRPEWMPRLTILTALPGAEILVDSKVLGHTPLPGPLELKPGVHRMELRRAGYVSGFREETLKVGDSITWTEELKEDAHWIAANGGSLVLTFSETHAMVTVDGVSRGEYLGSMRLAPGVHRLRAERAGFGAVERDVEVVAAGTRTVAISFAPTPETLVKFKEDYENQRKWGIAATVGGAVMVVGGAGVVTHFSLLHQRDCDNNDSARCGADPFIISAAVLVGVLGGVTFVNGIVLIARNADPHRYDLPRLGQKLTWVQVLPVVRPRAGGLEIGVMGAF